MAAVAAGVGNAILAAVAANVLGVDSDFAIWCVVASVFVAVFGGRRIVTEALIHQRAHRFSSPRAGTLAGCGR